MLPTVDKQKIRHSFRASIALNLGLAVARLVAMTVMRSRRRLWKEEESESVSEGLEGVVGR